MPDVSRLRDLLRAAGVGAGALGITGIPLATAAAASSVAVVANASAQAALDTAGGAAVTAVSGVVTGVTVRAFAPDAGAASCPPFTEANRNGLDRGQAGACDDT